jgi:hypothetical protein
MVFTLASEGNGDEPGGAFFFFGMRCNITACFIDGLKYHFVFKLLCLFGAHGEGMYLR